ncbi:MAG: radical SAM/SPASM domain-containing protein, partial [Bacteroidales bacterium]|nr:radical SAM/SPASM domain-containing protein [Bacteroidales bacterium]
MKGLPFKTWLACEAERKIRHIDIKEHKLKQLFWECTLSCNLACRHCGSDCKVLPSAMSMKVEDFLKALDSVKAYCQKVGDDPGHILVILTGGEPLMRKDLEECGRKIIQKGFPWGM